MQFCSTDITIDGLASLTTENCTVNKYNKIWQNVISLKCAQSSVIKPYMCLKTSLIYLHVTKPINNDKEELRHKSNEQKKYKKTTENHSWWNDSKNMTFICVHSQHNLVIIHSYISQVPQPLRFPPAVCFIIVWLQLIYHLLNDLQGGPK